MAGREFHNTVLTREISFPWDKLTVCIQWAAAICAGAFILAPVPTVVYGLHCMDKWATWGYCIGIVSRYVWPVAAVAALAALIAAAALAHHNGQRGALRRHPAFAVFLALAGWMVLSCAVNGVSDIALAGFDERAETIQMQFAYVLLLFPTGTLLRKEAKLWLARLYLLCSVLMMAFACLSCNAPQLVMNKTELWGFSAIFFNINIYGYYLAIAVPLAAGLLAAESRAAWKCFAAAALVINTVALAINNTMGVWVACTGAAIFLVVSSAVWHKRIDRWTLAAAVIYLVCLTISGILTGHLSANVFSLGNDIGSILSNASEVDRVGSGRWRIWRHTMEYIRQHPLTGMGFEAFYKRELYLYVGHVRPHNEYLQYALFYGIPAAVLYFAGCLGVFLRGLRLRMQLDGVTMACLTAAFSYLISAFFGLTLLYPTPMLFLFLGMGYVRENSVATTTSETRL